MLPTESTTIITYRVTFKPRKNQDYTRTEIAKLFLHSGGSIFLDNKQLLLMQAKAKNLPPLEKTREIAMIGASYFPFIVVKDFLEHTTVFSEEHLNRQYNAYAQSSMGPENWTLISDSDSTIVGLQTYKAECCLGGRTWTACFTPEIPLSDGPYKFSGLPGLILRLDSAEGDFSFEISGIERDVPDAALPVLPDYRIISEARFKEIQQMLADNPFAKMQSSGGKIEGPITVAGKVMTQDEFILYLKKDAENNNRLE